MARIQVFQGGSVQRSEPTDARRRTADFGGSALGEGLQALGKAGGEFVEKADQVEDIKARVEANRLAVEHAEAARLIKRRVKETLGDGAEQAANLGGEELEKATADILGKASPRAKLLLQDSLRDRVGIEKDSFAEHGYGEKVKAFESTSLVRIGKAVEAAADEDDEDKARALLAPIQQLNSERARFFGKGAEWAAGEDKKYVSQFFKSRALRMVVGPTGSAAAAIDYATKNRQFISDDDYNSIIASYNDAALDDMVAAEVDGTPLPVATVESRDPLAPLPDGTVPPTRALAFDQVWSSWYVPQEGSAYAIDNNGYGVKYGINAKAHPGENIKGMTETRAKQIIKKQYWDEVGIDGLPPAVAAVAFDTAVIAGPAKAKALLKESGGDPDKYMSLRKSFLAGLSRSDPKKYPPGIWDRRNRELEQLADRQGSDGTPLIVPPNASLDEYKAKVMARTDIGLTYKRKLIARVEAKRADARAERAVEEEDTDRKLTQATLGLGENFTDIKQLPPDLWLRASPSTRASLQKQAQANVENKPLPLDVERDIAYISTFKPESFTDPKVQAQLRARGVTSKKMADLVRLGAAEQGRKDSAKPEPVARGTLESLARPHFEAAGFRLWTTETSGSKKTQADRALEEGQDAQSQLQLMSFLSDAAQNWALNNPGKQADEATMKGWIGTALIKTKQGRPIGTLNDVELYKVIPQADRNEIQRSLKRMGLAVTPANISQLYRRQKVGRGAWQR